MEVVGVRRITPQETIGQLDMPAIREIHRHERRINVPQPVAECDAVDEERVDVGRVEPDMRGMQVTVAIDRTGICTSPETYGAFEKA
jgi:hypothetical protein